MVTKWFQVVTGGFKWLHTVRRPRNEVGITRSDSYVAYDRAQGYGTRQAITEPPYSSESAATWVLGPISGNQVPSQKYSKNTPKPFRHRKFFIFHIV